MSTDIAGVVAALRENPLFARLDARRLRVVALAGETLAFRDGEALFRRGDEGDAAYVIVEGAALVQIPTAEGPRTIATLARGELFGEIAALCAMPRTTSIVASGRLVTLTLDKNDLRSLLTEFPELALETIRILAMRLERTTMALAESRAG